MAYTSSIYRFGSVTSLKFLATENMPRITAKLHIVDYSRHECLINLSHPLTDHHEIYTQVWREAEAKKPTFENVPRITQCGAGGSRGIPTG